MSIIETDAIYNGVYFVKISEGKNSKTYKIIINK
nr:T9SS type A sorting domain-containing protein [uncultured Flavobacterium sp.]